MNNTNDDLERKPTGDQAKVVTDSLIDYVVERMAYSVRKFKLKREVSLILYGPVSDDQLDVPKKTIEISAYERLRKEARKILKLRSLSSTEEAREESIGFYENIISDDDSFTNYRIKARENLDKILGVASKESAIPITGSILHPVLDVDKLGLTLEQKKKLLEDARGHCND